MPLGGEEVDVAELAWITTETAATSGVATAASGFTINTQEVTVWGRLATVRLNLTCTAGLTATAGNLTDTTMCTLDAAYWPDRQGTFAGIGSVGVTGFIVPDGRVRLANADTSIPAGGSIELGVTYLLAATI